MAEHDTPTICLVLSEHLSNHYAGPLAQGAAAAAAATGCRLILYSPLYIQMTRRDWTPAGMPLLPRRADAYLLPVNTSEEIVAQCRATGARLLTYAGVRPGLPAIGPDNRGGARDATAHLIAHGRSRIVHLSGLPDSDEAHERHAGYRDALESAGLPYDPALVTPGFFRVQEAEDATEALLSAGIAFDAIFAANDLEARGAMNVLARHALRVPEDVAVVGFDDSSGSDAMTPPLTTVRQSAFQIGWEAIHRLAFTDGVPLRDRVNIPVQLIIRESCGCAPPALDTPRDLGRLAARLAGGQGPLVEADGVAAWLERLAGGVAGAPVRQMIEAAVVDAAAHAWHLPAIRDALDLLLLEGASRDRIAEAKDALAAILERRQTEERLERSRRFNAITYVIDLLRAYGYEQSTELVLRYMVNAGPRAAVSAQRGVAPDTIVAQRVGTSDTSEQWQGPAAAFPPPKWIAPGESLLLMPMDAGAQQRTLFGVIEGEGRAYLDLDDLLLRSINTYRSVTVLHETLQELDAARSVQLSLLPRRPPTSEDYDIAGATRAARQVGGDLYGYYTRGGGELALALGDVAGKGMPAALLMSACATALAGTIPAGLPPGRTLTQIHQLLLPSVGRGQNAAVCLAFLEGPWVRIANAGAVAPLVLDARGVRMVDVGGVPLGTPLSGLRPYAEVTLQLAPGDLIILSSDGIVEAVSERGERYGFERFLAAVAGGPRESAQAMLAHILDEVAAFAGEAEVYDDMALVVARYRGVTGR